MDGDGDGDSNGKVLGLVIVIVMVMVFHADHHSSILYSKTIQHLLRYGRRRAIQLLVVFQRPRLVLIIKPLMR